MKPSRFGDKLDLSYVNLDKIKKISNKDLQEVIGKFRTSIKSRMDEAEDYLTNGRATPDGTKGHNLRVNMEKDYLQKLENEVIRRSKK